MESACGHKGYIEWSLPAGMQFDGAAFVLAVQLSTFHVLVGSFLG